MEMPRMRESRSQKSEWRCREQETWEGVGMPPTLEFDGAGELSYSDS
jgi:hypothetical protein